MSPQRQLVVSVTLVAVAIVAAWVILFRNHVLTPPIAPSSTSGPTLDTISNQFRAQFSEFDQMFTAPVRAPAAEESTSTHSDTQPLRTSTPSSFELSSPASEP